MSNVLEKLDQPGEWYLDRHVGILYYRPLPGEDMTTVEVIAPVLKSRLTQFTGHPKAAQFVEHVRVCYLDHLTLWIDE